MNIRRKNIKQTIFSTTQTEIFLIIIFILLAISHISINEKNETQAEFEQMNKNIKHMEEIVESHSNNANKLEKELLKLKGDPPCKFKSGDQILMYVQFLPGKRYHFKIQNYVPDIYLRTYKIYAGMDTIMSQKDFKIFIQELYDYAQNFDEPCRYVFKRYDPDSSAKDFTGEEPLEMLEFINKYMYQNL
jgi:hypothetical protein